MKNKLPFLILITLALFSCKNKNENKPLDSTVNNEKHEVAHQNEDKHWTYNGETGPEHWVEIEKESDCDGKRQSPINIVDINAIDDPSSSPVSEELSSPKMVKRRWSYRVPGARGRKKQR